NTDLLPSAVIFRDSFFITLKNFIAFHFKRTVYYWQYRFDCDVIEFEKPDVVIQEISEHYLTTIKPENPERMRLPE
ncbi:MAG: hypothetical protein ABIK28_24595, partial [Planctomycetota bacterium]